MEQVAESHQVARLPMRLGKGLTQDGSNIDVVIIDAYLKNLTGIDWNLAYEAVVNDAENEPLD